MLLCIVASIKKCFGSFREDWETRLLLNTSGAKPMTHCSMFLPIVEQLTLQAGIDKLYAWCDISFRRARIR